MDSTLASRSGLAPAPGAGGRADAGEVLQRAPAVPGLQSRGRVEQEVRLQAAEQRDSLHFYFKEAPGLQPADRAEFDEFGSRARFIEPPTGEGYAPLVENPFRDVSGAPLSTFGLDVDTASYANIRRMLRAGQRPPADAVRLEELVNYFRHGYAPPQGDDAFAIHAEITDCPWNESHRLLRVGIKARELPRGERPPANLVFLVDVSGSMDAENKLPLVKQSLRLLLDQLSPRDTVGIVTYAGEAGVALAPTPASEREQIAGVLNRLRPGGGTAGAAGLEQAYALATNRFRAEGVNRVVLCTDGDFNIGVTSREDLLELITRQAKTGVFLSVLGYGIGNYKDTTAELLADKGNGNYAYIDSFREARKALADQLEGTLVTVARDVKLQLEFNPARIVSWRLLGYENRLLADRDFNDDTKDAGDIGAGHEVTALYELVPVAGTVPGAEALRFASNAGRRPAGERPDEVVFIKLRRQPPGGGKSRLMEVAVPDTGRRWAEATPQTRFAAAVAAYGLLLRDSAHKGALTWDQALRLAEQTMGNDPDGLRAEFVDLVRRASELAK
ncbi:MAG: vWA domain-containing protein [Limisphaerales bacterium]